MPRSKINCMSEESYLMLIDDLEVWVLRKSVKSLRVHVTSPEGRIEVSAPKWVHDDVIGGFIRDHHDWIANSVARILSSPMSRAAYASREEIEQWRMLIKALVPPLVAKWEKIMGVRAGQLAYRNMKSRWGSCQPSTGRICINIRLALFPPECLEYVVVHELCHLLEPSHGPRFKALMTEFLPSWERARAKLRP